MLTDGRRTTDAGVTGILIAHLRAFGSGELINIENKSADNKNQEKFSSIQRGEAPIRTTADDKYCDLP